MSKNKENKFIILFLLLLIFCLGLLLRFVKLGIIPPGFYVDEAAIGYNAYSILKTGKDEYGKLFPLLFRSFGDYKMPVYIYSSVVPIAILGLHPFSVRLISALSGSLTIVLVFLLTREIFSWGKKWLPLISALIFTISPWSVFFSRGAFESNLALLLFAVGIYFLVKGLRDKSFLLVFSFMILALSTYTYHTEKLVVPLFLFLFFGLFKKEIVKNWDKIRFPLSIGLIGFFLLEIPQLILLLSPASGVRLQNLKVLPEASPSRVIGEIFSQYMVYFSPRNLFFDPDPDPQRSLPELSVFYSWMVIPYLIGLWYLIQNRKGLGEKLTILLLLVSPMAAALTRDPFSGLRSQLLLLPMTIVIALGLYYLAALLKNRILIAGSLLLALFLSLISLYRSNFVLLSRERFLDWNYGFSQLAEKIKTNPAPKLLIDDPKGISYIELLFFLKQTPEDYQPQTLQNRPHDYYRDAKWINTSSWSNIQIRPLFWKDDIYTYQMIISSPLGISEGQAKEHYLTKSFDIIGPGGEIIFNGYITNPLLKSSDDKAKLKKMIK